MKLIKPEKLDLRKHPNLNESWLQDIIAKDPTIIGLGDLDLKDKERKQPNAGRLDLLLQDADVGKRYEVEIQLGKTDESHIIRTIEYWDIERKRYPQYEHCAVIIAEEITSRFLNVISLFNGHIPLIAIQLSAYSINDEIFLTFTKILDEVAFGLVDEDEEINEVADRNYWETVKGTAKTVKAVDKFIELISDLMPGYQAKYNKHYIGLAKDNIADNFILFRAKKGFMRCEIRMEQSESIENEIEQVGLNLLDYDKRSKRYRIKLTKNEIDKNKTFLIQLIKKAKGLKTDSETE